MTSTLDAPGAPTVMQPVCDDLSITCMAGPIVSSNDCRQQARDAERFGFLGVWIPERYTVKEIGSVLGAMGAVTDRITLSPGPMTIASRYPVVTASIALTLQSMYGDRVIMGMGRGPVNWLPGHGFDVVGYETFVDWITILHKLWRGEVVNYKGPVGEFHNLEILGERPDCPPPKIVYYHLGGPKASKLAAQPIFDGMSLANTTTAECQARSIAWAREECERIGRDPDTLRFYGAVTAAADQDEETVRQEAAARIVGNMGQPTIGLTMCRNNGWSEKKLFEILNQDCYKVAGRDKGNIDHNLNREQLARGTDMVPQEWIDSAVAVGTAAEVAKKLQKYKDAGLDEVVLYAGPPSMNETLIQAWRDLKATS